MRVVNLTILHPDYTGSVVGMCNLDGSQCPWAYEAAGFPIAAPSGESDSIYVVHHVPKENLEDDEFSWETVKVSAIPKSGGTESTRSLSVEVNGTSSFFSADRLCKFRNTNLLI
jgi:hypothetical protein